MISYFTLSMNVLCDSKFASSTWSKIKFMKVFDKKPHVINVFALLKSLRVNV